MHNLFYEPLLIKMKKYIIAALLLSGFFANAQNSLLNADFWKNTPDLKSVKTEITKGNNPAEANRGNHDVVSIAINNNAPFETIVYLIDQPGNSVGKTTHDGRLYLHWAASKGNAELVKYLLEKGSDINRTDDKGATAISFAAGNGQTNTAVYDLLFKAGNDPKQKFQNGANLLLLSIAYDKDLKLAEYLSTKGLSLKDTDNFGNTAFDYATKTGDVTLLKTLLQKGVKPTDKALIFASQGTRSVSNTLETYQYLVEDLKINPNATGDNGENVLHNLVKKNGQIQIINYFIGKGTNVNQADKDGNIVLMEAVRNNDLSIVKLILDNTKNIDQVNAKGTSALAQAITYGTPETIKFLLDNKANAQITDKDGNNLTAYLVQSYQAPRQGQKSNFDEKLTIIKNAGVNFDVPQHEGNSLYHLAVVKNDVNLLKQLESLNLNINAINNEGMSALHKAALVAKDDTVLKYLVAKGAQKDVLTEFDETAYDLAKENETLLENNISLDFLK